MSFSADAVAAPCSMIHKLLHVLKLPDAATYVLVIAIVTAYNVRKISHRSDLNAFKCQMEM